MLKLFTCLKLLYSEAPPQALKLSICSKLITLKLLKYFRTTGIPVLGVRIRKVQKNERFAVAHREEASRMRSNSLRLRELQRKFLQQS